MKFIEVVEGLSIRIDSIVSVRRDEEGVVTIQTEGRDYTIPADFKMLMEALDKEDVQKENMEKMTNQFFGG